MDQRKETPTSREKMTKIFGEGGYPYAYIDKLEDL